MIQGKKKIGKTKHCFDHRLLNNQLAPAFSSKDIQQYGAKFDVTDNKRHENDKIGSGIQIVKRYRVDLR